MTKHSSKNKISNSQLAETHELRSKQWQLDELEANLREELTMKSLKEFREMVELGKKVMEEDQKELDILLKKL